MWSAHRCLRRPQCLLALSNTNPRRLLSSRVKAVHETDSCGIPLRPTWSVDELLSSYVIPAIPSATLDHLHELSALVPPQKGTPEHTRLKGELEGLVRLVEAVRLVDTENVRVSARIVAEDADRQRACLIQHGSQDVSTSGSALLEHAARSADGFYVVDADRKR